MSNWVLAGAAAAGLVTGLVIGAGFALWRFGRGFRF